MAALGGDLNHVRVDPHEVDPQDVSPLIDPAINLHGKRRGGVLEIREALIRVVSVKVEGLGMCRKRETRQKKDHLSPLQDTHYLTPSLTLSYIVITLILRRFPRSLSDLTGEDDSNYGSDNKSG
jgi:hypothetical protein